MAGCCSDLKFRQRVSWLGLILYISATILTFYYMFEISNSFNVYALEHIHSYHTKEGADDSDRGWGGLGRTLSHVVDIPKPIIVTSFTLLYLQVFFMLIACTKQEPRFSLAYAWPWYIYNKFTCDYSTATNSAMKARPLEQVLVTPA